MHGTLDGIAVRHDVESALGRELLLALGNERDLIRTNARGNPRHVWRRRHLDVQLRRDHLPQHLDIAVVDVPSIAAKMHGDPLGARQLTEQRRGDRLRLARVARLAHGGDVVDVDGEAHRVAHACPAGGWRLAAGDR